MVKDYSHRLMRWLKDLGFWEDPFYLYEADHESHYLSYFFIDRPYLYDILGDPSHPQTAFLMARRGCGKTATCEMVAYQCAHRRKESRALPVRYDDFSFLLEQVKGNLEEIRINHHIKAISRAILKALVNYEIHKEDFAALESYELSWLLGCASRMSDALTYRAYENLIDTPVTSPNLGTFTPIEILKSLADIVVKLGAEEKSYQSLYLLVDRVDETALGDTALIPILKPLIGDLSLLEARNWAFKFFLPSEFESVLHSTFDLRLDRLCIRRINWTTAALEAVIQQRLTYYSNGNIKSLENICTPAAKANVMKRLLSICDNSPRTLLRLCRALFHHHVTRTDAALIDTVDINETLSIFVNQLAKEQALRPSTESIRPPTPSSPQEPPKRGLYLNPGGHIWIDGERLSPSLTEQEFALLDILYRHTPHIVASEDLIQSIWRPTWSRDQSYTSDSLRQLVRRVRKRLEPDATKSNWRFIQTARGRGYWLDTQ